MTGPKVSFFAKEETLCPVCENTFRVEKQLTGGGRTNAGELTDELHRKYIPTTKYGHVYPLIYPVTVCPRCLYAAYPHHFEDISEDEINKIRDDIQKRKNFFRPVFPELDFERERTLEEGIASYVLAALCYEHRVLDTSPTFYRALSFLRAGWLSMELHELKPADNFDYMARIFLRKAAFFYSQVVERESSGIERLEGVKNFGPDLDKNYGFDGVLYLAGVLQYKYGQKENRENRIRTLKDARAAVARIVGMGKSSKSKPSVFLDLGRKIHKEIKKELEEFGAA